MRRTEDPFAQLNTRARAAIVLRTVAQDGKSLQSALAGAIQQGLASTDRSLVQELSYGCCRWFFSLNGYANLLLERPLKSRDSDIHALILVGLYQLQHLNIPPYAAINETVAAARHLGKRWASGVVNAVLRSSLREQDALAAALDSDQVASTAHPRWLLDKLATAWPDAVDSIVAANNQRPPMVLRVNPLQFSVQNYHDLLASKGHTVHAIEHAPQGLILEQPLAVNDLPKFSLGAVSVQDGAAQLAEPLLELQPGQRVLDACAAPGGKCAHILESNRELAELVAVERDPARIEPLQQTLSRLGLEATIHCADAGTPESWWDGAQFDRILLDAPCSGSGVIRRRPDIKLLRRADDIATLTARQLQLLDALWPLLAQKGMLLYATCSVLPEENEQMVAKFLAKHTDASAEVLTVEWGRPCKWGRQILPGESEMDGFYYAAIRKV